MEASEADAALSGEIRGPAGSLQPLPMSARRIIAYRAMLAIEKPQAIINLGVGMPEVSWHRSYARLGVHSPEVKSCCTEAWLQECHPHQILTSTSQLLSQIEYTAGCGLCGGLACSQGHAAGAASDADHRSGPVGRHPCRWPQVWRCHKRHLCGALCNPGEQVFCYRARASYVGL